MNGEDRQLEEIAALERWFADQCHEHDTVDLVAIGQRSRMAQDEIWLADRLGVAAAPPGLVDRVRVAVRREWGTGAALALPELRGSAQKRMRRPVRWALGLSAAAAVLAAGVWLPGRETAQAAELPVVSAFEAFEEDAITVSLQGVTDDLLALELRIGERSSLIGSEAEYEDLEQALDEWTREPLDDDWS